jgi:EAL domain-containing protein (putative c-di-GMP-specific phosphodiesterase class I)
MFISAIEDHEDEVRYPLVDMIVDIARLYKLNVIAEGVETQRQWEYIQTLGCQQAQGFFLSKPIPGSVFIDLWTTQQLTQPKCDVKAI